MKQQKDKKEMEELGIEQEINQKEYEDEELYDELKE